MHRSEVRKPRTKASELVWRVPLALLRQRPFARLKLTHKILFVVLWNWAGCRAGSVSGSCSAIAAELGLADRRIREWLPKLAEVGLVVIVDWTREGALIVEVNDPAEVARGHLRRPDPQGSLFDNDEPDESETAPAFSVPFPPAETVPIPPTPSGDTTPRAQSSRFVSFRDGEMISAETIKSEWPTLRPIFEQITETLCAGRTALADRDYELFTQVAYLAGDEKGREWLEFALKRVCEKRPRNRVGLLFCVLAYSLAELETGRYPQTVEAKATARHRLGGLLRNIEVPRRVRPNRADRHDDADPVPEYLANLSVEERQHTQDRIEQYVAALSAAERAEMEEKAVESALPHFRRDYERAVSGGHHVAASMALESIRNTYVRTLLGENSIAPPTAPEGAHE